MIPEQIAYLTILISLFGGFFYIRDTLRGVTKPNRVTWLLWAVIPAIAVVIQIRSGVGLSVIPVIMSGATPFLVFLASFVNKNAYWKITQLDIVCGLLSVIAIILWLGVNQPILALLFAILADLLAGVPTLVKAWKFPETETGTVFILSLINAIIGFLVLKEWTFTFYSFGVYLFIMNSSMIFAIYRKKWFKGTAVAQ
jgi:hypothetical protein